MLIGELAKKSGFSRDTIRYYERIGLLELPAKSRQQNNYRNYPDSALRTLLAIRNLKELGFTLEEIREILVRHSINALDKQVTIRLIEQKMVHLDNQIDKLVQYRHKLEVARIRMHGESLTDDGILPGISLQAA
jgi:DNA-binding transcriptional MerR regulator